MSLPLAVYKSPNVEEHRFQVDPSQDRYNTTNGTTTGPSAYVLEAGQIDKDKPSEPKRNEKGDFTYLSKLRMQLTGLQDDMNEYLTHQMELAKNKKLKQADEQRIRGEIDKLLDGGDGDDESEEEAKKDT
ncbi:LANO_0G03730g1_1 [Lachancea nothofagi CBS 11611]|uniref:EKC/KEOPS complex subunit GON7 n=1 Tax=Lachancea nothofagi CBS 11611 TaxID=1266666 RepID=A0A1G4KG81_9SACH|nr:LANO_0G03730g1_1 [Lachancea nothofagi CBS 11611]